VANEVVFLVHEPIEGGYAAKALGHAIFTTGDTLYELTWTVRDTVVRLHCMPASRARRRARE
jgi:hypothetical protein